MAQSAADRTVAVVDDHRVFADLLRLALDVEPGVACVGTAASLAEARRLCAQAGPDVVIVDVSLPDGSGIDLVAELRLRAPRPRIVVLTAHPRPALLAAALAAGADAFLAKDGPLDDVLAAVLDDVDLVVELPVAPGGLTAREQQVLDRLARGYGAAQIAESLGISRHTTRDHVKSILAKLGVHSQLEAVVTAQRSGLVDVMTP